MKRYSINTLSPEQLKELYKRPKVDFSAMFDIVTPIIDQVAETGDDAIREYTQKFDGVSLSGVTLSPSELDVELDTEVKEAIDIAFDNIYNFHQAQLPGVLEVETMPGVRCSQIARPIERVGLYVPGGTAILPSTAMMLAIPAMIAGCSEVVLATPPRADGSISPEVAYIAKKAQISTILLAGGAQAIAGMALGTKSIPKVDKIFGPGNQFVTAAKMILQNTEAQISIDMPAGPSEVLVIADETANPGYVAADLLSQAEHGKDSQVVLVAIDGFDLEVLELELQTQLEQLPRAGIAKLAINNSFILNVNTLQEAFDFSNGYAPEHLIVNVENAGQTVALVQNAGSVFLGPWSPESVGDYASGTNHTLPTYGYARMYSGVSLSSFFKSITVQQLSKEGLKNVGPSVEILAQTEGLDAHKNAVSIRLKDLNN